MPSRSRRSRRATAWRSSCTSRTSFVRVLHVPRRRSARVTSRYANVRFVPGAQRDARARRRIVSLDAAGDHVDHESDAWAPVEIAEEHRLLRHAFETLNERNRRLLYLRDIEGLPYDDLAIRLGTSEQGARQAVARARRGLRVAFEGIVGGTLAVLWWLRSRIVSRLDQLHPAANLAMNTVLVAVLSAGAVLGGGALQTRAAAGT